MKDFFCIFKPGSTGLLGGVVGDKTVVKKSDFLILLCREQLKYLIVSFLFSLDDWHSYCKLKGNGLKQITQALDYLTNV